MYGLMIILAKTLRRFGRNRDGVAAVEFGLVALPFFMLMFGLAEVAMVGFAQTSLDHAVSETARRIRTGQAQSAGETQTEVETTLCRELNGLLPLDCGSNLFLDVDSYPSFIGIDTESPIQDGELDTDDFNYSPGGPSSVVVVRAYYRWRIVTPLFQTIFANVGIDRVLVSTMMFRSEPY